MSPIALDERIGLLAGHSRICTFGLAKMKADLPSPALKVSSDGQIVIR